MESGGLFTARSCTTSWPCHQPLVHNSPQGQQLICSTYQTSETPRAICLFSATSDLTDGPVPGSLSSRCRGSACTVVGSGILPDRQDHVSAARVELEPRRPNELFLSLSLRVLSSAPGHCTARKQDDPGLGFAGFRSFGSVIRHRLCLTRATIADRCTYRQLAPGSTLCMFRHTSPHTHSHPLLPCQHSFSGTHQSSVYLLDLFP